MATDLEAIAWPIRTDRLTIRPVTMDDAGVLFAHRQLPNVNEWLTSELTDVASYRVWLRERLDRTLVLQRDGEIVGELMVRIHDAWGQTEVATASAGTQAELGWVLDPRQGGQGLMTEAVVALIDVCFGTLGLRRVIADCFADNTASWRLMERVGMRREAHTRADSLHRTRGWLDGYTYALLAAEWAVASTRR